jgi:hypothetical protein
MALTIPGAIVPIAAPVAQPIAALPKDEFNILCLSSPETGSSCVEAESSILLDGILTFNSARTPVISDKIDAPIMLLLLVTEITDTQ